MMEAVDVGRFGDGTWRGPGWGVKEGSYVPAVGGGGEREVWVEKGWTQGAKAPASWRVVEWAAEGILMRIAGEESG